MENNFKALHINRSGEHWEVGEAALRACAGDTNRLREALSSMLEETRRLSDSVHTLLLLARADLGTQNLVVPP
ncbi:MAG: hypothetical protein JO279_02375 [Verrucomicrobia bacterium]|nr:hypothetical protein [Verrucomicrobiota bacterium]